MDMTGRQPAVRADARTRFLLKIAAVDEETLRECPEQDWDNARAVAMLMLCTWLYQAALFTLIGHRLFAARGEIRPDLIVAAGFIAAFVLQIDSYMIMRSGWHQSGMQELKRGGLDVSGGAAVQIKAACFLVIRIILSIGIAQLTAVFVSLLIFGSDIDARVQAVYAQANVRLISEATLLVDADIQRAVEAVKVESTREAALSAQSVALRQSQLDPAANDPAVQQTQQEVTQLLAQKAKDEEELRRAESFATNELGGIKGASENSGHAGNGPRHRAAVAAVGNARTHLADSTRALDAAQTRLAGLREKFAASGDVLKQKAMDQTPEFEHALADEHARLAALKDQLASLTQGRDEAIRKAVENAPGHTLRDDGFLAQIATLQKIAQNDTEISTLIILIDVVSFGFELAAVLAKVLSYVPTTYAALLARDAYMRAVEVVDGMMDRLNQSAAQKATPAKNAGSDRPRSPKSGTAATASKPQSVAGAAAYDPFGALGDVHPRSSKRPRGRPRKAPLAATVDNEPGQAA